MRDQEQEGRAAPSESDGADVDADDFRYWDEASAPIHGRYIVAPDSADPLPPHMWTGLKQKDIEAEVARVRERPRPGAEKEHDKFGVLVPPAFYISPAERAFLLKIGSGAMKGLLRDLDRASAQAGTNDEKLPPQRAGKASKGAPSSQKGGPSRWGR